MAKARKNASGKPLNKSAAIREMIAEHPGAQSKEVVSFLGEKGVKVQPSLVYYIKSKQRQQKRRQKREHVKETTQKFGSINPVALILQVRTLARDAGGIGNLKQLVDALAE